MELTNPLYEPKTDIGKKTLQTITNELTTCGVIADKTGLIVNGKNAAETIDANVFNDRNIINLDYSIE